MRGDEKSVGFHFLLFSALFGLSVVVAPLVSLVDDAGEQHTILSFSRQMG
jgi:hypothetical protein